MAVLGGRPGGWHRGPPFSFRGPGGQEPRARLRVCRFGAALHTYHAPYDEGAWQEHMAFERPDLPAEVQVGLSSTENSDPADITGTFDRIEFRTPTSMVEYVPAAVLSYDSGMSLRPRV